MSADRIGLRGALWQPLGVARRKPYGEHTIMGAVNGWTVERVATCPSTNVELAHRAMEGEVTPKFAMVADYQTAGIGRGDRKWITPPEGALTFSALINPDVPNDKKGPLPLFVGLAVCRALESFGLPAKLKWPNDILLPAATPTSKLGEYRKVGGILCQIILNVGAIVGIGINILQNENELPVPDATSLALAGKPLNRDDLLEEILKNLDAICAEWETDGPKHLISEYESRCASIGRQVSLEDYGASETIRGTVQEIADDGAIVVELASGALTSRHFGDLYHF